MPSSTSSRSSSSRPKCSQCAGTGKVEEVVDEYRLHYRAPFPRTKHVPLAYEHTCHWCGGTGDAPREFLCPECGRAESEFTARAAGWYRREEGHEYIFVCPQCRHVLEES